MKREYTQKELLILVHETLGFTAITDENKLREFVSFRSLRGDLANWLGKKSISKQVAIDKFLGLDDLDRRKLLLSNRSLIPLLPKDVKLLIGKGKVPDTVLAVGTRSFNPGKQIEFNVYSMFDALSAMPTLVNNAV